MPRRPLLGTPMAAVLVVGAIAVAAAVAYWAQRPEPEARAPIAIAPAGPPPASRPEVPDGAGEPADSASEADTPWLPPGFDADDPAVAWAQVDLESVREAMPDNLYWSLYAPTRDPDQLAERAEEQEFWREQRARVESGNASEEQVDEYFEHRFRVHSDAVEFTTHLIDRYGDALPERDLRLLHIARNLNLARVAELPKRQAEAQGLRERQERAREAWRAQQSAFEASGDAPDPGSTP